MVQRFFHATATENVPGIQKEGLKPIWDFVYLTDSLESAQRWMGFRFKAAGKKDFAIVEVEYDSRRLKEGMDHSPLMVQIFGVGKSLTSAKKIAPKYIKEIHYFAIGF